MDLQARLEFALEATATGMWSVEPATGLFEADLRVRDLWGLPSRGPVTLPDFLAAISKPDSARLMAYVGGAEAWPEGSIEVCVTRPGGQAPRWIALRGRRTQPGGEIVGTAHDITDHKQHDAQVHLLMREVTHRSKNLLAIIQAMARRTVKNSLTAADFEERFSTRLRGLSFSHEILASQDWRGAALKELVVGHLGDLLERHADRVKISGPVVFVRPEAAQNLGLALNELSTNAAKFGALASGWGLVTFDWQVESDVQGPRWLRFTWHESGDRPSAPPVSRGFGHEVMERVVARALDGVVETSYPASGFEWSLRIPVSHISTDTFEAR